MDLAVLNYVFPIIAGFALYLLKRSVDQLDKSIVEIKTHHAILQTEVQTIRTEYLHKSDFREFKTELREMFEELKSDIKAMRDKSA